MILESNSHQGSVKMNPNTERLKINEIFNIDSPADNCPEHWEMVCVTKGELTITCGNQVYKLNSGNVAIFSPYSFHYIIENQKSEYFSLIFTPEGEIISCLADIAVEISADEMILLEKINLLKNDKHDNLDEQLMHTMLEMFLLLCCKKQDTLPPSMEKNAIIFSEATKILINNIDSQISVTDLADRLNISLSNLKRIFATYTGIGVHEYLNFLKIVKAKELLTGGETVTSTAELTGFANQAYFSAAFKRITGITPKEYALSKKSSVPSKSASQSKTKPKDLPSYLL